MNGSSLPQNACDVSQISMIQSQIKRVQTRSSREDDVTAEKPLSSGVIWEVSQTQHNINYRWRYANGFFSSFKFFVVVVINNIMNVLHPKVPLDPKY